MLRIVEALWHWSSSRAVSIGAAVFLCMAVLASGLHSPRDNWDTVGYVASLYAADGYSGEVLRQRTYADLRDAMAPNKYRAIIEAGHPDRYAAKVYRDAESLEQHLPFYDIRVAYLATAHAVAMAVPSYTRALRYTTVLFGLVCGLLILGLVAVIGLPMAWGVPLALSAGLLPLTHLTTPGTMVSAASLGVAYLALSGRHRSALITAALLPLVRTDFVILSVLVALYYAWSHRWRAWPVAAALFAIGLYESINISHGNYGYLTIFNFTFFDFNPHPADMAISGDLDRYVMVYFHAFDRLIESPIFYLYLIGAAAAVSVRWQISKHHLLSDLYFVALAFMVLHLLLFPAYFPRFFFFVVVINFLMLGAVCHACYRMLNADQAWAKSIGVID